MLDFLVKGTWRKHLDSELEKVYFQELSRFVDNEYSTKQIYPPRDCVFNAFQKCTFEAVKVVIIGQDPYHGPNQANGFCFSVSEDIKHPPSLVNIFKERETDLGMPYPVSGDLISWAKQGVLLLNATLTVEAHQAGSHQKKGWEQFTDAVIQLISDKKEGVVFVLWGGYAQKKGKIIDVSKHHIIKSAHPSPLSVYRGFWGSKPFSKVNELLVGMGKDSIDWSTD